MTRTQRLAALAVSAALCVGSGAVTTVRAQKQDPCAPAPQPKPPEERWRFTLAPYAWAPGLSGNVGIGPVETHVDESFSDLVKRLKFAFMLYGDARYKPWLFSLDGIYVRFANAQSVAIRGDTGAFSTSAHLTILQPMAGYSIGDSTWSVDFMGGGRYWNMAANLDVDRLNGTTHERSGTVDWTDAVGAARATWKPVSGWRITAGGDGGGGSSRSTWQAYGLVGYEWPSKFALSLAYRGLWVDYDRNGFLFDTNLNGPLLAASWRF